MPTDAPIHVLYDGDCPLCSREVNLWRKRDRHHRLQLLDIAADDFDPAAFGLTRADVQARMHAILPDGRVVTAVDAFRHIYHALGMGWLLAPTAWPILRPLADMLYRFFAARIRPRLARRHGMPNASCKIHHR